MSASREQKPKFDDENQIPEEFIGVPLAGELPEWHPPELESMENGEIDDAT
jgi:hypothetical protein